MAKSDDKGKEGVSSTGGTAPTESPPAEGGSTSKRKPAKVTAVFLKRITLAGPQYPGGCRTFSPAREEGYRKHRGGPRLTRTVPADTWTFDPATFAHLAKQGIVARSPISGGDA